MANGLFTLKQVNQALRQSAWTGQKTPSVQYLVVAGGGGGGRYNGGGGGGAGGLTTGVVPVAIGTSYTVTIGGGGAGGTNSGTGQGISGQNSLFGVIAAIGGGGGGGSDVPSPPTYNYGLSGGSGGGSGTNGSGFVTSGQGTVNQGNAGGFGNSDAASWRHGGGGGGAGTIGFNVISGTSGGYGNGGAGIASAINGTVTSYAGGGGGGAYVGARGIGGVGGGGNGGESGSGFAATAGTANTGGGGGGGGGASGAAGGSGIVILSYPDTYAAAASTSNATVTTSGSGSISFVRASGQYLTYANPSSQFSLGTNAFTIECWVRLSSMPSSTGYPASYWLFGGGPFNSNTGIDFYINNTQIGFNLVTFASPTVIGNHGMTTNTWYHVAVVRGGSSNLTVSIFVNGTRVATGGSITDSADAATTGIAISAAEPSGATQGNLDGFISNYRIVKGTAVYDPTQSSITVPTAPLTAIPNTQLLLNTVSGAFAADSSSNAFSTNATPATSPTWNSSSPFTVTGYKNRVYTWTTSGSITF